MARIQAFPTSSSKLLFQRASDLCARYVSELGESVAGFKAGQFVFRKVDDVLRILEKTVQWSVQPQINPSPLESTETEKKSNECLMTNGSKKSKLYPGELVRPLPWVLFIPLLLIIRFVRKGAEMYAYMLEREVTTPKHMVRYIQGVRRRLRAIKYRGMRNARTGVATSGDADKSHTSTTPSPPSASKSQLPNDGSDLGSGSLSKNKRKFSDRDESSSSDDDNDDDGDAVDAEATPSRQGSYLDRLLQTAVASDSDNDPDFQPNSSMEANSTDSDALGSDESDESDETVEVKRLSQPTSLINADIIEEEVEISVDSPTILISEVEDQEGSRSEINSSIWSVSSRKVLEGDNQAQNTSRNDDVGSEYGSAVSLSVKSVDIASSIEKSDKSDSSAMQKMSSLFAIKKKKPADVK